VLAVDRDADIGRFDFAVVDEEIENLGKCLVGLSATRDVTEECSFDLEVLDRRGHES